jgi:hypothetical protein
VERLCPCKIAKCGSGKPGEVGEAASSPPKKPVLAAPMQSCVDACAAHSMTCKFAHVKVLGCSDLAGQKLLSATHALAGGGSTVELQCDTCSPLPLVAGDPAMERLAQMLPVVVVLPGEGGTNEGAGVEGGANATAAQQGTTVRAQCFVQSEDSAVEDESHSEDESHGRQGWKFSSCSAVQNFDAVPGVEMRRVCACSASTDGSKKDATSFDDLATIKADVGQSCTAACEANGRTCSMRGFSKVTIHCTLYSLYTAHCTHYTLHCTHYTLHCTHYTLHSLYTALYSLCTAHCTHYTLHCTHYTVHCTHYTLSKVNTCEKMKSLFPCKVCSESEGPDQPCYVDKKAPDAMQPGTCLVKTDSSVFDCGGKHPKTARVCVCC